MRIVLIADSFPPEKTSAAIQLRDLAKEIVNRGHDLTVILPSSTISCRYKITLVDGYQVLRLKSFKIKDMNKIRRTVNEFLMPLLMRYNLSKSPYSNKSWDIIIWYSPSIFHGPLVKALKRKSNSKAYLIIRDIFPEWALDLGLIKRGITYSFFKFIANYQYKLADTIGVQAQGNLVYFKSFMKRQKPVIQVLPNWLGKSPLDPCSILLNNTPLSGKKVFVYAGNMGVAQGMEIILNLAIIKKDRSDVGFLFVGRGSELIKLKCIAEEYNLKNVIFRDEIHPNEISRLYDQCFAGIVALSHHHKSHNIPGKFLTYMQNGLPCFANINAGNDLADLIRDKRIGCVSETNNLNDLSNLFDRFILEVNADRNISDRCRLFFEEEFSVEKVFKKIIKATEI